MAASPVPLEAIVRLWQSRGVAPCAQAQADGVPCPSLGRQCETCSMALEALEDIRAGAEARGLETPP